MEWNVDDIYFTVIKTNCQVDSRKTVYDDFCDNLNSLFLRLLSIGINVTPQLPLSNSLSNYLSFNLKNFKGSSPYSYLYQLPRHK